MKRFVQVELADLSIDNEQLKNTGLHRPPTWDELFEAVHTVVQSVPEGFCQKGPIALAVTADSVMGGRCFLYAAFTWAAMQILVKNRVGVNIGGIGIRLFGGPKGEGA